MHYVYLLQSLVDNGYYTGCTKNLRSRLELHRAGSVRSTQSRLPVRLIYYEACLNKADAYRRERYLKSGRGKEYIRKRLRCFLEASKPGVA